MPTQLALYEQLSTLHKTMAEAAFALDWDRLILLEQHSSELTVALQQSAQQTLNQDEGRVAALLIQGILEKQDLIRDEINVWRGDAQPLLDVLNRSQTSS